MRLVKLKASQAVLVLAVLGVAQLAVPVTMILAREATLRDGRLFRFETAPVDPVDALRGRYVALNFAERRARLAQGERVERGQWLYVEVLEDPEGMAHFGVAHTQRPESSDVAFLKLRALRPGRGDVALRLPYDRFYMDEKLAPAAERAVGLRWGAPAGEERPPSHARVRVHGGRAVLEDVIVGDQPLAEAALAELEEG